MQDPSDAADLDLRHRIQSQPRDVLEKLELHPILVRLLCDRFVEPRTARQQLAAAGLDVPWRRLRSRVLQRLSIFQVDISDVLAGWQDELGPKKTEDAWLKTLDSYLGV